MPVPTAQAFLWVTVPSESESSQEEFQVHPGKSRPGCRGHNASDSTAISTLPPNCGHSGGHLKTHRNTHCIIGTPRTSGSPYPTVTAPGRPRQSRSPEPPTQGRRRPAGCNNKNPTLACPAAGPAALPPRDLGWPQPAARARARSRV